VRGPAVTGHVLPVEALPHLDLPLTVGGLVVGHEAQQQPVIVQLFRNRPTHVGVFAAAYVAKLLAFRALAVGAEVAVVTPRSAIWQPLAQAAPAQWVTALPPAAPTPTGGTAGRPTLVVEDVGMDNIQLRGDLRPWQTQVVVRPFVTPQMTGQLRSFDAVLLQRTQPEAVYPVQSTFGLTEQSAQWLPRMPDETVALIGSGQVRYVNLVPTAVERTAFGAPTRLDG
jgi:ESX secretion system protein EccE